MHFFEIFSLQRGRGEGVKKVPNPRLIVALLHKEKFLVVGLGGVWSVVGLSLAKEEMEAHLTDSGKYHLFQNICIS